MAKVDAISKRYQFKPQPICNMCGSDQSEMLGMRLSASQGVAPRRAEGIAVPVKRCRSCGLVFSDPMPIPNEISDHYGTPPEDYWSVADFAWTPKYFAREIEVARRLLPFHPGMKALDIGVGLGKAMRSLDHAGFDTWGIEPSAPFRNKALEINQISPDRVQLAPMESANFDPQTFDFITFGAVLEHLFDPALALELALKWLKPGGIIQAEVPNSNWLIGRMVNRYFQLRGTNYVTNLSPMHSPFHLYEFSLGCFRNYNVAEHYFEVCDVTHIPRPFKPLFRNWMERTHSGMQLTVFMRK